MKAQAMGSVLYTARAVPMQAKEFFLVGVCLAIPVAIICISVFDLHWVYVVVSVALTAGLTSVFGLVYRILSLRHGFFYGVEIGQDSMVLRYGIYHVIIPTLMVEVKTAHRIGHSRNIMLLANQKTYYVSDEQIGGIEEFRGALESIRSKHGNMDRPG